MKQPSRPRILVMALLWAFAPAALLRAKSPGQEMLDEGSRLYQESRFAEALDAFTRATELDPALLLAWENRGWASYRLQRMDETLRVWNIVLSIDTGNIRILNQAGIILQERGDAEKAAARFAESLRRDPGQYGIRLRLGDCRQVRGEPDRAIEEYRTALFDAGAADRPAGLTAAYRLMALLESLDREDEALHHLEAFLEKSPECAVELGRHLARLEARLGDRAFQAGAMEPAEQSYRRALDWEPGNPAFLVNLGWTLRQRGENAAAIRVWRQALSLDPGAPGLHRHLAAACRDAGDLRSAREEYLKAWEIDAGNPEIPYSLAEMEFREDRLEGGEGWLEALFRLPDVEEAWSLRAAGLYIARDRAAEGLAYFQKRLGLSPEAAGDRAALGRLLAYRGGEAYRNGRIDEAISGYRSAIEAWPKNPPAHRDLGWIYWKAERWEECERTWKDYAALYPETREPYNLLVQYYLQRKSYAQAVDAASASIRAAPDQPDVQLKLAKAFLWNNQFREAGRIAEDLAARYPEHARIQQFWGELLMKYHDFERGKEQWTRIIDMGAGSPRADYYLTLSRYETGEYKEAALQARELLESKGPNQQLLQFLAADADIRGDRAEVIRASRELTRAFPGLLSSWLALAGYHLQDKDFDAGREVLLEALKFHPGRVEVLLAIAENALMADRVSEAEERYLDLTRRFPENRPAFLGLVNTEIRARRYEDALALLEKNRDVFLSSHEAVLLEGRLRRSLWNTREALSRFSQVYAPAGPRPYLPILLYHGLGDHSRSFNLPAGLFESQIRALKDAGYTAITVDELGRMLDGKMPFPKKPVMITFDDARNDALRLGDPILAAHGMKATLFVPTGKIVDGHPFFADWKTIRGYEKSGRWELQSHGHLAHDFIAVDAKQGTGGYLINRQWLDEEDRQESEEEFRQRIDKDYQDCRDALQREVPGIHVTGYAFPFSEAGQESAGNVEGASALNEELLFRYYRFGFFQDPSGFNSLAGPPEMPRMMRRFTVPRFWTGYKLLAHLAEYHPKNIAAIEVGQSYLWSGQLARSKAVFDRLALEQPLLVKESSFQLANLAWQEERYRDAGQSMELAQPEDPEAGERKRNLNEKVLWRNRPRIGNVFQFFDDSDGRTNLIDDLRFTYPLPVPVDVYAEAGLVDFREDRLDDLFGEQFLAGADWQAPMGFFLSGQGRWRTFEGEEDTRNLWVQGRHHADFYDLRLGGAYEDVETLRAHRADLQSRHYDGSLLLRFGPLVSAHGGYGYRDYEDDNFRHDVLAGLRFKLPWWPEWSAGAHYSGSDTHFVSELYYTPVNLHSAKATLACHYEWGAGWLIEADGGFGIANDSRRGTRWVGSAAVRAVQIAMESFRFSEGFSYSSTPSYRSIGLDLGIEYRF